MMIKSLWITANYPYQCDYIKRTKVETFFVFLQLFLIHVTIILPIGLFYLSIMKLYDILDFQRNKQTGD